MKSILNKDIIMDIRKSKGRFLSILFIVALGVAFFSGIKVSPIVMKNTSDKYYDDYNLMDIKLISTLGLTDDDISEIKKIKGVKGIFPTYSMDVLTEYKSNQQVLKVHSLELNNMENNNDDYINRVKLVEGRLPQKSGECVIERNKIEKLKIPLGTKIKLKSGTDKNISDSLKNTEYTVVGYIETPYYLSYEKGSSSIGSGAINKIVMIPQEDFKIEAYTEAFLTVDGAKGEDSYSDKYFDKVNEVTDKLDNISKSRIDKRYNEVIDAANEELQKGKKEFEDKQNEVNNELKKAESDINTYSKQIESGENRLKNKKNEVSLKISNGKNQISLGERELKNGYKQYENHLNEFNENKNLAQQGFIDAQNKLEELNKQIHYLNNLNSSLEEKLNQENLSEEEKNKLTQELSKNNLVLQTLNSSYKNGKNELENKKQQFKDIENKLSSTKATLDSNKEKLSKEKENIINMEAKSKLEFDKAENELKKQKQKIEKSKEKLNESKIKANDELIKAENKIKDSEDDIKKIEKPQWYILDRNSHYSYAEYAGCANSIDALAKIFPVFFFSVAALVCLTTMTRMVDEQRINIGTLKGLGYTTGQIAKKYILYALSASLLGSILGLMIGYTVFPIIVFNSYGIMYTLPPVDLVFDVRLAVGVTLTAILITTIAAYSACFKELRETPSVLMRPRAPKNGKRIMLERIPFIWNKIGFIGKVTIRNIFRYKKRFLMTVLGISGCSALILSGLGIQDSIQMIVDGQYGSIFKYDMSVNLDNNIKNSELINVEKYIKEENDISNYQFINNQNGKISVGKSEKSINIVIPKNSNEFKNFVRLKDRKSQKKIELNNKGIVLSEKAARDLNIKVGDSIDIVNNKDKKARVKVLGIAENYISHYAYISKEYYKEVFKRDVDYNRVIGILNNESKSAEDNISKKLISQSGVNGISFNTGLKENFETTIENLNYVVLIMTISAGALAFVVLYNLTNVNISERIREIATIKVLGFYDNEVSAYIYRENIILTVIGTITGLGIGKLLHQFIMVTVEIESMMFGRIIESSSYLIAAVLTITLGLIVNLAMYYKLKNVEMVESLKSVD
ncbi:FtsX-like permease family protein [Clostridium sp. CCUG 7971]|uniref:FtsX-like permease family protein n=1 Tax=Clostridium sp. CCUG 7971 TaxID=2811414 RepID=UPI001ABB1712|nr:FtsX-like permease family protein [Clostridium sp. CCUG 7971]MBO3443594.1 FtsX-like permease family protein [Clostridium sp. CCUG 7971]